LQEYRAFKANPVRPVLKGFKVNRVYKDNRAQPEQQVRKVYRVLRVRLAHFADPMIHLMSLKMHTRQGRKAMLITLIPIYISGI
jgi:hypothetical protein